MDTSDKQKRPGEKAGKPAKLKRNRAITLKPHVRPDGTYCEPVIILDCETTAPIRVEGAEICYR